MKKILIITGFIAVGIAMVSCGGTRRKSGRAYMPDMAYSTAYETYASTERLEKKGVPPKFNGQSMVNAQVIKLTAVAVPVIP